MREDEKGRETHEFAFYRKALLRANLAARAAYYRTALGGHPWMEVNEVRADEDMNPDPEGYGIAKPLNMGKGGSDSGTPADEGDPEGKKGENGDTETKAAKRRLIRDIAKRMAKRLIMQAERAAKQPATFTAWLDTFAGEHRGVIDEAFEPRWKFAA